MNFNERLNQAVQSDGRTKEDIANALGIHPPMLSRWLKNVQPRAGAMQGIADVLNVNVQWLLTGEGPMKPSIVQEEFRPYDARPVGPVGDIFVRTVPVVSWAHAGAAVSYEELPAHWQAKVPTTCKGTRAFGLMVEGDSMMPKCEPGDIVTVDPDQDLRNGCLIVAKLKNDGVVLRRFTRIDAMKVRLIAYNPLYPSTEHPLSDFHWIYPVHSTFRRELL